MTKPVSTAQLFVTYSLHGASRILVAGSVSRYGLPETPEAKRVLAQASAEFDSLTLDGFPEVAQLAADIKELSLDTSLGRAAFKKKTLRAVEELSDLVHISSSPKRKKGDADIVSYGLFEGWERGEDGEWRNPAYSSNVPPRAEGVSIEHDAQNGCAVIRLEGKSYPVSLHQLHELRNQSATVIRQIQDNNSQLYGEKAKLQFLDTGYIPGA